MSIKKGFTLIEMLIVVLIIAILAAIALPQYRITVEKSRAAEGILFVRSIKHAKDRYRLATGSNTPTFDDLDLEMPASATFSADKLTAYTKLFRYNINNTYIYGFRTNGLYFIESNTGNNHLWCGTPIDDKDGNVICAALSGMRIDHSGPSHNYYRFN